MNELWIIHGPTCPVVITLCALPGGILSMRITDAKTGVTVGLKDHQSYGFLPYQCDQLEDALRAARETRAQPGLTEPVPR